MELDEEGRRRPASTDLGAVAGSRNRPVSDEDGRVCWAWPLRTEGMIHLDAVDHSRSIRSSSWALRVPLPTARDL